MVFLHRLHIGTQHAVLESILMIAGCADQISLERSGKKSASQFISRETAGMKRGISSSVKRRGEEKRSYCEMDCSRCSGRRKK